MSTLTKRKNNPKPRRPPARELPEDIMAEARSMIFKVKKPFYRRKRFNFIVGVSVGLLAMYAASTTPAAQTSLNTLHDYLLLQLADIDLANILPQSEMVDEFLGNFTNFIKPTPATEISFMPAADYKEQLDLKPHFPVVMIPAMIRSVLLDKESWTEHIMLDPITGLDPPDYKVRAVHGVEAADYFITGYWVWAKVIENLATIGYDTNTMHFASYDWRLSFANLEVRDLYYSHLKNTIELSKKSSGGRKSVVVTHSMGSTMFPYFLKWVESEQGGKGGPNWVNNHIESFVNIAGPLMGVPKAVTSLLSGETRDTMALGSFGAYVLEKFFSRRERTKLMRSWFGGSSMLPKGGSAVWGSQESAPDDEMNEEYMSFGNMISFVPRPEGMDENSTEIPSSLHDPLIRNYTVTGAIDLLLLNADDAYGRHLHANYSFGLTTDKKQLADNDNDPTKWSNPLESRLPNAPDMKIYCFYGVGVSTERSYFYAVADDTLEEDCFDHINGTGCTCKSALTSEPTYPVPKAPNLYIDASVSDPVQRIETGIRFSDGDGTVPLLSLGYMCAPSGGWTKYADLYNPGHSPVILREYQHEISPSKLDVRGGYKASDHIDILGNWEMTVSNVTCRRSFYLSM
ncbi:Lecithin:cholesterol acyltransferase-domain-containing protein [Gilbertella persicaria]|uniref:Lecithin:cholesterol acyltransferase-domain-containing protein n=1 Tax=Gilbertella persicaria TaxID=101096 RepID=UPI00221F85D5|nr:Lecithin:cholesterol acyltransferase-domain-containing protein [Gilbertella persicaria]KAI8077933.1 Lecithin:cholesterol acyltransferase-domain-containing protein [Gilbertella persicaria]